MKGIVIKLKNGSLEWIDPADEIIINNGEAEYKYKIDAIENIGSYDTEDTQ